MKGEMIEIGSNSEGTRTAYLAEPSTPNGRGIVLLFEVYGLHDDMKAIADRYAEAGYTVLVPDLFWKKGGGVTFDYSERQAAADTFNEIGGLWSYLSDVDPALEALKTRVDGPVALMGIGLGGITAFAAASEGKADAAVSFYPAMLDLSNAGNFDRPWLYHIAEEDKIAKAGLYDSVRSELGGKSNVEIKSYPGAEHGFVSEGRPEYDATTAAAAHAATLDFLDRVLS